MPCPDGSWWWTLELSLAYPLTIASVLPLFWIIRHQAGKAVLRGFPVEGQTKAG